MGSPPLIDGRLNDEAWTVAGSATGFVQRDPDNGQAATEATRLQFAYDDRYLYIAVFCQESAPDAIASGLGRRDDFPSSDYVGTGFDPRHDHLTGYQFETNPSAVQRGFALSDDDRFDFDYNAVWEVRTQVTDQGWTAEFRIPFSQMRFSASPQPGQVWGLNSRVRSGARASWAPGCRNLVESAARSRCLDIWSSTIRWPRHGAWRCFPTCCPAVSALPPGPPISARRLAPTCASGSGLRPHCRRPSTPTSLRSNRIPPSSTSACSRRSFRRSGRSSSKTAGRSCRRTGCSNSFIRGASDALQAVCHSPTAISSWSGRTRRRFWARQRSRARARPGPMEA